MAGEVTGKVYESITKVALEMAIQGNKKGWRVLWHEQPDWVGIDADLVLGKDKDNIEALFMVTHSTSEKDSKMKFLRNVAELFQWKVQGDTSVRCYDIIFNSSVKPELKKISESLSDFLLVIPSKSYGDSLIKYVKSHKKHFGNTDEKRIAHAEALITCGNPKYDTSFANLISELSKDLKSLLNKENTGTATLWDVLKTLDSREIVLPDIRTTFVRNGMAKLIIFDDTFRQSVYDSVIKGNVLDDDKVPQYVRDLNLVFEDMMGYSVDNKEIISTINILGQDNCEDLVAAIPERMKDFLIPLRSVGNIDVYSQFIINNFDELKTPHGMKKWLLACYKDPVAILPLELKIDIKPIDTWLFPYCMTLEKAEQGKVVAYGLSNLATETGYPKIAQGGFVVPPFVYRQKNLEIDMLEAISKVFAEKIERIGIKKLSSVEFIKSMKAMLIQRQMYILSVYRYFNPLADLVRKSLDNALIKHADITLESCLKEYADASAATSQYIKVGTDTLICWQTVTEAGRVHKTKELSARIRSSKAMWNGKKFCLRPEAKRIFFVADGEWREKDFKMLMRSGVDGIFYPDQMDQLVKSLKDS